MSPETPSASYINARELSKRTGISTATIWRLKRRGKIPFYQPGGKGSLVKFPADAIERVTNVDPIDQTSHPIENPIKPLPGPRPKWMSAGQDKK